MVAVGEEGQERVVVFNDFSGGLNTKLNTVSLPKNQGDIAQNIRLDTFLGALTKRQPTVVYGTASATEPILGMHRLYKTDGTKTLIVNHGDQIDKGNDSTGAFTKIFDVTTGDRRWQWLTWQDFAIGMDGYNYPVKYDGSSASATNLGSALAVDAGSGAGPNGTYTYKISCYSATKTAVFNVPSNSVTVTDNDINLTMIPFCDETILGEDIIGRKVYRNTVADQATWKLLSNGTIANNSTVILTDSDADAALGASYPSTTISSTNDVLTPPKGRFSVLHNGRLWIANDPTNGASRVYYSEIDLPEVFYSDSYVNVRKSDGDEITGIKNVLGKLTVFKNNTIQKIYDDEASPDDWSTSDPFSFIGCQAPYSITNTPYGIFYLGNNGIYNFNGQYSQLLSEAVTPEIRDVAPSNFANVWSAYFKNGYYMAHTSEAAGATSNNCILIYDALSKSFDIDIFNANVLYVLSSGTDVEALFSGSSTTGKVYAHTDTVNELVHKSHSDFAGTWDDMRYISEDVGGNVDSAVLELAWTSTIDDAIGTIDAATGIIDRPDQDGFYYSQVLNVGASAFDKIYWNQTIPSAGGTVTFYVRGGATTSDTVSATWSAGYTNSAGSDISNETAGQYVQYRIDMGTNDIRYTPNVYETQNYVIKLTYDRFGATDESGIEMKWRSGWIDFVPGYKVTLKQVQLFYDWSDSTYGTLNLTWETCDSAHAGSNTECFEGDSFAIDMFENPDGYKEYFTGGGLTGRKFRYTLQENSLNELTIKEMLLVITIEPLV